MRASYVLLPLGAAALLAVGRYGARGAAPVAPRLTSQHSDDQTQLVLPAVSLPYLLGGTASPSRAFSLPRDARGRYALFVFFTWGDCYKGMADIAFWTEIQERFAKRLLVIGVTTEGSAEKLRFFLEHQNVRIPVLFDSAGTTFDALGRSGYTSPALVLADTAGTVVRVDGPEYGDATLQASYLLTIDRVLGKTAGIPTP